MKTENKIGLLSLLVLLNIEGFANHLNGWWVSDQNQRIEILVKDRHILITSSKYRQAEVFIPIPGRNAYRNHAGEQLIVLAEDELEMQDRSGRNRTVYYKQNSYSQPNAPNSHLNPASGPFNMNNCDGQWYNPSTGLRLQIDDKRHHLKVRFQRDRWTLFYQQQRGRYFADDQGNTITLDRNGITYRSVHGDLIMVFTRGHGFRSGDNPFFEEYSRHYHWN